jgi:hypothetical protein
MNICTKSFRDSLKVLLGDHLKIKSVQDILYDKKNIKELILEKSNDFLEVIQSRYVVFNMLRIFFFELIFVLIF